VRHGNQIKLRKFKFQELQAEAREKWKTEEQKLQEEADKSEQRRLSEIEVELKVSLSA
jgi:hypothetical protein